MVDSDLPTTVTTLSAILTRKTTPTSPSPYKFCNQIRHFLSNFGYDCRSILKHDLKSYDIFCDVHDSRKRVVGFIYTKQFVS